MEPIRQRKRKLKDTKTPDQIGRSTGHPGQKYILTDEGRQLLYRIYDGKPETIDYLSEQLKVPRLTIKAWAVQCGLTRRNVWTPEQLEYLERHYSTTRLNEIAERIGFPPTVVQRKAHQLGLRRFDEGYTAASLADALGVTKNTVGYWVKKGWLPCRRRESNCGDGWEGYYFTDRDVRTFIIKHREKVKPTAENWHWLVDVLAGGKYGLGA